MMMPAMGREYRLGNAALSNAKRGKRKSIAAAWLGYEEFLAAKRRKKRKNGRRGVEGGQKLWVSAAGRFGVISLVLRTFFAFLRLESRRIANGLAAFCDFRLIPDAGAPI
jgi:hypothetical protein